MLMCEKQRDDGCRPESHIVDAGWETGCREKNEETRGDKARKKERGRRARVERRERKRKARKTEGEEGQSRASVKEKSLKKSENKGEGACLLPRWPCHWRREPGAFN